MALLSAVWYTVFALIGITSRPEKSSMVYIDPVQILSSDTVCPDAKRCSDACQEDPRFETKGSCIGPDSTVCLCDRPHNRTDLTENAETNACDEKQCRLKCKHQRMPLIGKCWRGVCRCGLNSTELRPARATGCELDSCYDHCYIGLIPPLVYYCDLDRCRSTGCPDDTKCSLACQGDPRFQTRGSCVGPDRELCSCEPPHHATEQPLKAEATSCNEQECIRKCSVFVMPMTGRCRGDACQCGWFF